VVALWYERGENPSLEAEWQGSFRRLFKRMTDATMSVPKRKYA
jgi:hypothetical protein